MKRTNIIGRPGVPGSYKVPEGFGLWLFTRGSAWNSLSSNQYICGDSSINAIMEWGVTHDQFQANDVVIFVQRARYREASRNWTASGSNPRIRAGVNYISFEGNNDFSGVTIENTDPMIESASCATGALEIGQAVAPYKRLYRNTDPITTGIEPRLRVFNFFADAPGSRAFCVQSAEISIYIQARLSLISSVSSGSFTGSIKRIA